MATFVGVDKEQLEIYTVKNNVVNYNGGTWRVWRGNEELELEDGGINGKLNIMS